jgi:fatty-acyl-CoA synthase
MTEVGAVFGMPLDREIIARKAGSVGVATPRVQTRIVDEAGEPCPPGVPGELLVRGDTVSPGYLRRRTSRDSAPDGWFRTGDVFVVDSDGFHTVVDRKKDMFISGGENVYPAEVEAQLSDFPGVAEVAVVGVPDSRWGEVGHLAFVASAGAAPEPAALLAHLQGRVARYKIPAHVTRLEALPRTPSGKLLKARLRALLQASTEGAED